MKKKKIPLQSSSTLQIADDFSEMKENIKREKKQISSPYFSVSDDKEQLLIAFPELHLFTARDFFSPRHF